MIVETYVRYLHISLQDHEADVAPVTESESAPEPELGPWRAAT